MPEMLKREGGLYKQCERQGGGRERERERERGRERERERERERDRGGSEGESQTDKIKNTKKVSKRQAQHWRNMAKGLKLNETTTERGKRSSPLCGFHQFAETCQRYCTCLLKSVDFISSIL